MSGSLAADLGLGPKELVAFVGAGGKSTLLLRLGRELASSGNRFVLTTTTKMGADQVPGWLAVAFSADEARQCVAEHGAAFLVGDRDQNKITGVPARVVNELSAEAGIDFVLVEADGARGRSVKVPAGHEPVVPTAASLVVVVAGIDAIGRPISEAAHRPALVAALLGCDESHRLTPADLAAVVGHREGGLARLPEGVRTVVALTKARQGGPADRVASILSDNPGVERVVTVPALLRGGNARFGDRPGAEGQ